MDLALTALHQRTPLFLGSPNDVAECEQLVQGKHPAITTDRRALNAVRAAGTSGA